MLKISEKLPFFRADMAGLGIYHMGGYGRIGVYRVKVIGIRYLRDLCKGSFTVNKDPPPAHTYPPSRVDGHIQPTPSKLDGEVRQVQAAGPDFGID